MRYVFKRFGEALEIIIRPQRYVRLDEKMARDLEELAADAGYGSHPALPGQPTVHSHLAVRQIAVDMLRFGMTYQWTVERNVRAWEQLTPREQEVAALVCLGYTNDEIAERLVIASNTVKSHVRNLLQKFDVNGKLELKGLLSHWDFSEWEQHLAPRA